MPHKAMLVMVHCLDDDLMQITVLNFSGEQLIGTVRSEHLIPAAVVTDMFTENDIAIVDGLHSFSLALQPYEGVSLLVTVPEQDGDEGTST